MKRILIIAALFLSYASSAFADSRDLRILEILAKATSDKSVQAILAKYEDKLGEFSGIKYGGMGEASFGPIYLKLIFWDRVENPDQSSMDRRLLMRVCETGIDFNISTQTYKRSWITSQCRYTDNDAKAVNPMEAQELRETEEQENKLFSN